VNPESQAPERQFVPRIETTAARLASLVSTFQDNQQLCARMRQFLEPLERGGMIAVTGETELLKALDQRLARAEAVLRDFPQAKGRRIGAQLDTLGSLLTGVDWDLARELQGGLEDKRRTQEEVVREYDSQTRDWRAKVNGLKGALNDAIGDGALVTSETEAVRILEDLVMQAERALRERRYGDVTTPLHRLIPSAGQRSVDQLMVDIYTKARQARELTRRAELLMLKAPSASDRVEYTLVLRTPSVPGSLGINIQGSRTLARQDRARVRESIDDVTTSINRGIRRRSAGATRTLLLEEEAAEPSAGENSLTEQLQDVGDLMYRFFVPDPVQRLLAESDCSFTITTNDLELPWELMHDGDDFLCVKRPVGRFPMGRAFPRKVRERERIPDRIAFLLVYADPVGNLPGAEAEVRSIERALTDRWQNDIEVTTLIGPQTTGGALNHALLRGTFDVIHYAGHAKFESGNPDLSGLVLHDHEVFFAQKIQSLVEGHPLVFLNACESSRIENEQDLQLTDYLAEPAEGLASAFVYGGALGCIGALWPVYDQGATEFAVEFYNRLLEGSFVGEALRLAREEIRRQRPDEITWASYILYGDPTFRLAPPSVTTLT
jgi:hypothetical protein